MQLTVVRRSIFKLATSQVRSVYGGGWSVGDGWGKSRYTVTKHLCPFQEQHIDETPSLPGPGRSLSPQAEDSRILVHREDELNRESGSKVRGIF